MVVSAAALLVGQLVIRDICCTAAFSTDCIQITDKKIFFMRVQLCWCHHVKRKWHIAETKHDT